MSLEHRTKTQVFCTDTFNLYHYQPAEPTDAAPLLIVFSMINSPSILDIHPKRSFIRALLEQGLSVFVLEWCASPVIHQQRPMASYILRDMPQAIAMVRDTTHQPKVHVMGICQGGYFALCLNALQPELFASVIPVVTPVDFHAPGCKLNNLQAFQPVINSLETVPYISGEWLSFVMQSLNYEKVMANKQAAWAACEQDEEKQAIFYAVETWAQHYPNQPTRVMREFLQAAIVDNALIKCQLVLKGQVVDLAQIKNPILNISAENDHLWSPDTPEALSQHHQSPQYETHRYAGGHIGVLVGEKALLTIPQRIAGFIKAISHQTVCKPV